MRFSALSESIQEVSVRDQNKEGDDNLITSSSASFLQEPINLGDTSQSFPKNQLTMQSFNLGQNLKTIQKASNISTKSKPNSEKKKVSRPTRPSVRSEITSVKANQILKKPSHTSFPGKENFDAHKESNTRLEHHDHQRTLPPKSIHGPMGPPHPRLSFFASLRRKLY